MRRLIAYVGQVRELQAREILCIVDQYRDHGRDWVGHRLQL
jgi:hypothetical protein